MVVTMKQIAELAGVSTTTVDRALKKRGRIAPDVAERICKLAETLDYQPNTVAKSLSIRNKKLSIGIVLHIRKNYFFDMVIEGVNKAAEEIKDFGITVIVKTCKDFDYQEQLELISDLVSEGVNAFAIVPINHVEIGLKISNLSQNGIPVIQLAASLEESINLPYVGCDYQKAGRIAAGLLNNFCIGKGKLVVLSPSFQMWGHYQRVKSLKQHIMAHYPAIEILEVAEMSNDAILNYSLAKEALERNPEASLILCGGASSILRAVEEFPGCASGKTKVVSFDYSSAVEKGLEKGLISATITQNPQDQGYRATMLLFHCLTKSQPLKSQAFYSGNSILIKECI